MRNEIREIEVKAKIDNAEEMVSSLEKMGYEFSGPLIQNDFIFVEPDVSYFEPKINRNILRIRIQNDKIFLTLKISKTNELDSVEREIEISDKGKMEDIIAFLGFKKEVEVHKTRLKTRKGDYEICVDKVERLGDFIEVEKMSDQDANEVQKELFGFLMTLGVKEEDQVFRGYDSLIYESLHKL